MDKNTVWAIVLSTIVIVVFMFIQMNFFAPTPTASTTTEQLAALPEETTIVATEQNDKDLIQYVPTEEVLEEEHFVIETEKIKVTFTNRGGDIISYELKEKSDVVQMAENITATNRAFSIALGGTDAAIINDVFNVKQIDDYSIGFYRTFATKNPDGTDATFVLAKQYTFKPDDYMFRLDVTIDGDENFRGLAIGNTAYNLRTSPQIGPKYNPKNDKYEYRTFMSYSNDKKKKARLNPGQTRVFDKPYTWTGVAGKYFEIIGIPLHHEAMQDVLYYCPTMTDEHSDAQVFMTRAAISANQTNDVYYFYVGPRTEQVLKTYNHASDNSWSLSGLKLNDSLESSGILSWLEIFLKWCLELINKVIRNWGVDIIILTILIKILLFPLTKKSTLSTLKMQEVQPRMQEIQQKYKDQPDKMNMEMAKLYKETGFNPMSGCLPLLIQFPLIFAMYNLFNNYFEFRGAEFIPGWIPDLSRGDSVYTLGFNLPLGMGNQIRLLPVIYLVSQLIFSKITGTGSTAGSNGTQMKIMMYAMPIFFFFAFYNAPSGLLIYWTVSNVLQLFQQMILNRVMKAKRAEMEKNKEEEKKVFVPRKKK